jgi:hypothetical protein
MHPAAGVAPGVVPRLPNFAALAFETRYLIFYCPIKIREIVATCVYCYAL